MVLLDFKPLGKKGEEDGEKSLCVYRCDWCSHEFERTVKRKKVSDKVTCDHCGNILKTWS